SCFDRHHDAADRPEHGILRAAEIPHPFAFRVSPARPAGDEKKHGRETRRPYGEAVEDKPDRHDDLDRERRIEPCCRGLETHLRHERFDEVLVPELHDQVRNEIEPAQDAEKIESRHVEACAHRRYAPSESPPSTTRRSRAAGRITRPKTRRRHAIEGFRARSTRSGKMT